MKRQALTDSEYIAGLRSGDRDVTHSFFYGLMSSALNDIRRGLMGGAVDYDELVSELFLYLSDRGWFRLDSFEGRGGCSLRTWMTTLVWRYFMWRRNNLLGSVTSGLDDVSETRAAVSAASEEIRLDVAATLGRMPNRRYADVLRLLLLEGYPPEEVAARLGVSVANLYNLKHRAIVQFVKKYRDSR